MPVPILKQGDTLIASVVAALTDEDLVQLRDELAQKIGKVRARSVVIDVTALDVLDSFATRTLRGIAYTARLRGAETVDRRHPARGRVRDGAARPDDGGRADGARPRRRPRAARREAQQGAAVSEVRVQIEREADIVLARQAGRELAAQLGFSTTDQTLIATAISEVARNIVVYAQRGEIVLTRAEEAGRVGIQVSPIDQGPGIENKELAMRDGYSTKNSLGLGLPGARRLMDDFALDSEVGQGHDRHHEEVAAMRSTWGSPGRATRR